MRLIFARCSCNYRGRVDAQLEIGDRLIVIKDDGAVLVHGTVGLREKNWMPSGTIINEELDGRIVCDYPPRGECLEIYVETVYFDNEFQAELAGPLIKMGSERHFADLLVNNLDLIEPGLELIAREASTDVGPIDLLCKDQEGNPVIVEVKRHRAVGAETSYQLLRYRDALVMMPEWKKSKPRGILVAPGTTRGLPAILEREGFKFVRLGFDDLSDPAFKKRRRREAKKA